MRGVFRIQVSHFSSDDRTSKIENLKHSIFICALLFTLCPPVQAQQPKTTFRIGFLSSASVEQFSPLYDAFRQGLRERGYFEGQNITIEARWAHGKTSQLQTLAAELVAQRVDVIVATGGTSSALAAKQATATIPVVFTAGGDLVKVGLIESLAQPGGNLTGLSLLTVELAGKRLQLLKETFPKLKRVGILGNPDHPAYAIQVRETEEAAKTLGLQLHFAEARHANELDSAFLALRERDVSALLVQSHPLFFADRKRIVDLAAKSRFPAIYESREFAQAGGLMSYGTNFNDVYGRAAIFVDKILKGARPADLPVEQPTKFEMVVNLKTAKRLGLTILPNVLARADQVIR